MESVEEICDEITLINNGITILQGEINSIKNQFRNNTFQIEVHSNNLKLDGFKIIHQDENNFTVQVPSDRNSKELITEILKTSEIISFNEKIPSMEEIFIKTVSNG